jgi:hypothetical protein
MENLDILISKNTFNYLMGIKPSINDLRDEFPHLYNTYIEYQKLEIENPSAFESIDQYFVINDENGKETPICKGGESIKLRSDNLKSWIENIV